MLIRCGLSKDNLVAWQKNSKEKDTRLALSIVASKSKYAPIVSKIVYSIIELAKSIFGSSNSQELFRIYKKEVINDLKKEGIDFKKYTTKDFKLSYNYGIKYAVLENDLKIEGIPEQEMKNRLQQFEKLIHEEAEKRNLADLVRK